MEDIDFVQFKERRQSCTGTVQRGGVDAEMDKIYIFPSGWIVSYPSSSLLVASVPLRVRYAPRVLNPDMIQSNHPKRDT